MRAASSVRDVLADPMGASFAGESFVVWFQPRLAGAFMFRRLHPKDQAALGELLVTPVLEPGYDMLCDCSTVEVFDDRAFELMKTILEHHSDLLVNVRRIGLVRPFTLAGAGIAGLFYDKVRPKVEAGLFADRSEALSWLGYPADATERAEIDELIANMYSVSPALRELRTLLFETVADATLARAAVAIGMSERSLQRELAEANTSFRSELNHARVRIAESLLTSTDDKVAAIAKQLGLASVSAFTSLFGRLVGETPHEFRERRRQR